MATPAFNKKKTLYVVQGGLDEQVTESILHAAFVPFGEIVDIILPIDPTRHRGFAFIEYELPEDAAAALDNMHNSELFGRVIKCNLARPTTALKNKPVWEDEAFMKELRGEKGEEEAAESIAAESAAAIAEKSMEN